MRFGRPVCAVVPFWVHAQIIINSNGINARQIVQNQIESTLFIINWYNQLSTEQTHSTAMVIGHLDAQFCEID